MVSTYRATQLVLLRGMAFVYLCAFWSFWLQIPELYSHDGLLPVQSFLKHQSARPPALDNLLAYHDALDIHPDILLEWLCIVGIALSFFAACGLTVAPIFLILWALYASLMQVGQTFLHFQWDALLLETGAAAVMLAPLVFPNSKVAPPMTVIVWFRVILFKLLFMTAIVKLQSRCPSWLQLTALHYHYATQCIPNAISWYAHQLPGNIQKVCVAIMFVIQLPAIFLMFIPWRGIRRVGAWVQILLQLMILLTGNYNWFNLHTILLAMSLMDDELWPVSIWASEHDRPWPRRRFLRVVVGPQSWASLAFLVISGVTMFEWSLSTERALPLWRRVQVNWKLTVDQINEALPQLLAVAFIGTAVSFGYYGVRQLWAAFQDLRQRRLAALGTSIWHVIVLLVSGMGILMNTVPLSRLDESGKVLKAIPKEVQDWYIPMFAGSYGLFRRMTGIGPNNGVARPEVIIEGSIDGIQWHPYEFHYKPGNVKRQPPFVVPHQPRVDWQMWFAALGHYRQNHWFLHLCYKLLQRPPSQTVNRLLADNPFPDDPPNLLRASLWHYDFTSGTSTDWWQRHRVGEYLPTVNISSLAPAMRHLGWMDLTPATSPSESYLAWVAAALRQCEHGSGLALVLLLFSQMAMEWRSHAEWKASQRIEPPKPKAD